MLIQLPGMGFFCGRLAPPKAERSGFAGLRFAPVFFRKLKKNQAL